MYILLSVLSATITQIVYSNKQMVLFGTFHRDYILLRIHYYRDFATSTCLHGTRQ